MDIHDINPSRQFSPETWLYNQTHRIIPGLTLHQQVIFFDNYFGGHYDKRFYFWDIDLYPTFSFNDDWLFHTTSQVSYYVDFPFAFNLVASDGKYLIVSDENGLVQIHQKGQDIKASQILADPSEKIVDIEIHLNYLIVSTDYGEINEDLPGPQRYVYNLIDNTFNGSFSMHEEDGPFYAGNYVFDHDHETGTFSFSRLDTFERHNIEFKGDLEPLSHGSFEPIPSQDMIMFDYHDNKGMIAIYSIPEDRIIWTKPTVDEILHDLDFDRILLVSYSPTKTATVFNVKTGDPLDTFDNFAYDMTIPHHTPTKTRYIMFKN